MTPLPATGKLSDCTERARLIAALLASSPGFWTEQQILTAIYGQNEPAKSATNQLIQRIGELRSALGSAAVVTVCKTTRRPMTAYAAGPALLALAQPAGEKQR